MPAKILICTCRRCGHQWATRGNGKPQVCPNPHCHSVKWNIPRSDDEAGRKTKERADNA